jgi:hypothetical protein
MSNVIAAAEQMQMPYRIWVSSEKFKYFQKYVRTWERSMLPDKD